MFAVGMLKDRPGVHRLDIPPPEISQPDEVLIRMKEVGLDGTDFNLVRFGLQDIAEGRDHIVMGHEGVGVVEAVGSDVHELSRGDVVSVTVRRGCGECQPCRHNQSDMCMTGRYQERGLHKLDGVLSPLVVDREQYVVKVPADLARLAVFTEPLSIAEKAVEQIRTIQSRLPWFCGHGNHGYLSIEWGGCKVALVLGAGPLGLMSAALLRLAQAYTYIADVLPKENPRARLARTMKAQYVDVRMKTPEELATYCSRLTGELDIVIEASGAADTALRLIPHLSRSSIYVMTGIPREQLKVEIEAAQLVRQIVRFNQVIVGSVNSNRRHFEMALGDLGEINRRFGGMLTEMVTHRFSLAEFEQAFSPISSGRIKTVIEVEPWG